eukprot:CAMPEP_0118942754 /NCGR_PEP_ID=MMETSP1169-20130426/36777_1 /TAXON_ID=36882 /ORGANISM="Pyramimonas obovata, Strain CCMP722" /LENGTH=253 /DNA_ID=CAMNT_0006887821 /DNA_START=112 /DNA_END=874 /DNA_ORIENTATION=+
MRPEKEKGTKPLAKAFEILEAELRRAQLERNEALYECMRLRNELQPRCYSAEERAEHAELRCEEKDRQLKRKNMKMKMKVDALKERYQQHLLAVCEEAEAKLRAGQNKDAQEMAALQGAAEKQSSVVQYLQSSLERMSTRAENLESQLHDSNECLREEQIRNAELHSRVVELEKIISNERRARQLANVVGTARECRERVEEQVKAMVKEGVSMESKWGAQRKSLESLSHRLATCEATVYAGAGKLGRTNQDLD